jgi:DNA polymerase III subunit chi
VAAIGFYHLTRDSAETALPLLLDRTLASGERAVVRLRDAERLKVIDMALWQAPELFLPHGSAADAEAARHAEIQPIWLTVGADDNPAGARFLFLLDGVEASGFDGFERVFDLFDGNDDVQLASARARWTERRAAGHALSYFRQEGGRWLRGG